MTLVRPSNHLVIDVSMWPLEVSPRQREILLRLLSDGEKARADRFLFAQDRDAYIAARGGMRLVLAACTGVEPRELVFGYGCSGKPHLEGRGPHFNLSHSAGLAALAVCRDHPIGIDIEKVRAIDEAIAERFFSTAENAALDAAGDDRQLAFFRCWTRKEALVKALGCGLSLDTRSFSVATGRPAAAGARFAAAGIESDEGEDQAWALFDLVPGQGFVGAIALKCRKQTPRITLNSHPPSLETPIGTIHSMAEKVGD